MRSTDEVAIELGDAIGTVMAGDGEMVTRWVALIEVIDSEGERALWTLSPPDSKAWDTLGLLDHARTIEQAAVTANFIDRNEWNERG